MTELEMLKSRRDDILYAWLGRNEDCTDAELYANTNLYCASVRKAKELARHTGPFETLPDKTKVANELIREAFEQPVNPDRITHLIVAMVLYQETEGLLSPEQYEYFLEGARL